MKGFFAPRPAAGAASLIGFLIGDWILPMCVACLVCGFFGGTIVKDDGEVFVARKAPAAASCPILGAATTTTSTSSTTTTTSCIPGGGPCHLTTAQFCCSSQCTGDEVTYIGVCD